MTNWFEERWTAHSSFPILTHGLRYGTRVVDEIFCNPTSIDAALFRILDLDAIRDACLGAVPGKGLEVAYPQLVENDGAGIAGFDLAGLASHGAMTSIPWSFHRGAEAVPLDVSAPAGQPPQRPGSRPPRHFAERASRGRRHVRYLSLLCGDAAVAAWQPPRQPPSGNLPYRPRTPEPSVASPRDTCSCARGNP